MMMIAARTIFSNYIDNIFMGIGVKYSTLLCGT